MGWIPASEQRKVIGLPSGPGQTAPAAGGGGRSGGSPTAQSPFAPARSNLRNSSRQMRQQAMQNFDLFRVGRTRPIQMSFGVEESDELRHLEQIDQWAQQIAESNGEERNG